MSRDLVCHHNDVDDVVGRLYDTIWRLERLPMASGSILDHPLIIISKQQQYFSQTNTHHQSGYKTYEARLNNTRATIIVYNKVYK